MPENDDSDSEGEASARQSYMRRLEEMQKQQQQEAQLRSLLKQMLEPPAYERIQNVRLSNPELYSKVIQLLVTLYQQGRLKDKVSEEQLKSLLSKLLGQRKEGKISFARK